MVALRGIAIPRSRQPFLVAHELFHLMGSLRAFLAKSMFLLKLAAIVFAKLGLIYSL